MPHSQKNLGLERDLGNLPYEEQLEGATQQLARLQQRIALIPDLEERRAQIRRLRDEALAGDEEGWPLRVPLRERRAQLLACGLIVFCGEREVVKIAWGREWHGLGDVP